MIVGVLVTDAWTHRLRRNRIYTVTYLSTAVLIRQQFPFHVPKLQE